MVVEASRQMITIGSQSNATGSDGVLTIGGGDKCTQQWQSTEISHKEEANKSKQNLKYKT